LRLVFDIETDGLLDDMTKVHSLVIKDVVSKQQWSCADKPGYVPLIQGVRLLNEADEIIGHNIINFDIPALKKVFEFNPKGKVTDTLVISSLIYTNLKDIDIGLMKKGVLPNKLWGSQSLKAWGYRLGVLKGDFHEDADWSLWSPEMQEYCEQDVEVTIALLEKLESKNYSPQAIELEHRFATIIQKQIEYGFLFDVQAASSLYAEIAAKRAEIEQKVVKVFGSWYAPSGPVVTPNRSVSYKDTLRGDRTEGCPFTPIKHVTFNPSSRDHIAFILKRRFGWEPTEFTDGGKPKVDETVLSGLDYPEARLLAEYFLLQKRAGQIAEGDQAWLKTVKSDGRIHGSVRTNGAVTGRCTHSHPNVAQVPAVGVPFGEQCRACFTVPRGRRLVGCDASGLELRCLAHYMARWDGGAYADVILNGDIHTVNQKAAGLPTRNNAKTFIYAFLYGAGPEKIGSIIGKGADAGKKLMARFLDRIPALKNLKQAVATAAKRGYLIGLDGRHLHVRSEHAALNTLLQSAGALVMKQALIILYDDLTAAGYVHGKHYAFVANIHDEFQIEVDEDIAEMVGQMAAEAIRKAGEHFNFRCPLAGEYKIGGNWAETH